MELQKTIKELKGFRREIPFTTSIRIEKELYDEVVEYLNKNCVAFSHFINSYLKEVVKEIKNGKPNNKAN